MIRPERPRAVVLALALALAGLGGCAASPAVAPDGLPDALHGALRHLISNPDDVKAQLDLSEMFLRQRDYLRARQYLALAERSQAERAPPGRGTGPELESEPEIESERMFRLAIVIAVRSQQYQTAVHYCTQRLEKAENAAVRGLLAAVLEAAGDEAGAARQLRLLCALHPDEPRRLYDLARFYERSTHLDRRRLARELYRRYLDTAPAGPDADLARTALSLDQLEQRAAKE